jgi:hypothetical protein
VTAPLPADVDVLVAGSGAAGLVAALAAAERGARVLVAERGEAFGGTTALSGGRVWVPGNAHGMLAGLLGRAEAHAAATYLQAVCPTAPEGHVEAFVATAPAMAQWIERTTPHRFVLCPRYPDYHPSRPGATQGGRTLDSKPLTAPGLDGRVLRGPASAPVTHAEWERWRFVHRYDHDLLERRAAEGTMTGGRALVAALLAHLDAPDEASRDRAESLAIDTTEALARRLAGAGIGLGDAVSLFVAARRPFLTELGVIARRRSLDPDRLAAIYDASSGLLDRLLLRLVAAHQEASR